MPRITSYTEGKSTLPFNLPHQSDGLSPSLNSTTAGIVGTHRVKGTDTPAPAAPLFQPNSSPPERHVVIRHQQSALLMQSKSHRNGVVFDQSFVPVQQQVKELKERLEDKKQELRLKRETIGLEKFIVPGQRYADVLGPKETRVGVGLSANTIGFNRQNIAIASEYPTAKQLEAHFTMLLQQHVPALVVLASDYDMQTRDAPNYLLEGGHQYGKMNVIVSREAKHEIPAEPGGKELTVMHSAITITDTTTKKSITIPGLRVTDWPDKRSLPFKQLEALAQSVIEASQQSVEEYKKTGVLDESTQEEANICTGESSHFVPVIHCMAGVGRSGQVIGAIQIILDKELRESDSQHLPLSVEEIVTTMREQRSEMMVQTEGQLDGLIAVAVGFETPLLKSAEMF